MSVPTQSQWVRRRPYGCGADLYTSAKNIFKILCQTEKLFLASYRIYANINMSKEIKTNPDEVECAKGVWMLIRVDRSELTRNEIIRVAANRFLNDGYSKTTVASMAKSLGMSTGNMTFHFPTKEHMLAELVDILSKYQWKLMEEEAKEGYSSVMAVCLELLTIASACEQDEVAKDFFLSSYRSELCMEHIRRNDKQRAKAVFKEYCPDWTDAYFEEAETLVSGIEYATLLTTSDSAPLDMRVAGALRTILSVYNVPKAVRDQKIRKVLSMDYDALGLDTLRKFREYVDVTTEQALLNLLKRKQMA